MKNKTNRNLEGRSFGQAERLVSHTAEHPILFSTTMIEAILSNRKTQTRRVATRDTSTKKIYWVDNGIKIPQDGQLYIGWVKECDAPFLIPMKCPYGKIGDRLWVRETFAETKPMPPLHRKYVYRTDYDGQFNSSLFRWKPSIHMPRKASRITLEITDIRVEQIQEINHIDSVAEGMEGEISENPLDKFRKLWNKINEPRGFGWDKNPWVWVVSFRRCG